MRKIFTLCILILNLQPAFAETISAESAIGAWKTHRLYPSEEQLELLKKLGADKPEREMELLISDDLSVEFRYELEDGVWDTYHENETNLKIDDGLIILKLFRNKEIVYKIALSGYSSETGVKLIFGTLFKYWEGEVVTGRTVGFEPCDDS